MGTTLGTQHSPGPSRRLAAGRRGGRASCLPKRRPTTPIAFLPRSRTAEANSRSAATAWVFSAMLLVLPALLALGEAAVVCPPHSTSPACGGGGSAVGRHQQQRSPNPFLRHGEVPERRHHHGHHRRTTAVAAPAAYTGGGGGGDGSAEDVASRAYLSPVVFEAKARSRGPVGSSGTYGVTFVVQRVHKGDVRRKSQVRLQFMTPPGEGGRAQGAATPLSLEAGPQGGGSWPVQANIRRGGKYVVFARKIGPHNYSATGEPVQRSRKILAALQDVLCDNCVKPPSVSGLKDVSLKVKQKLRLVCRTKGNPLPSVAWYKDGQRIQSGKKTRITTKKHAWSMRAPAEGAADLSPGRRRSTLVIPRLRIEDGGVYECRAVSVTGASAAISARVTVSPGPPTPDNLPSPATVSPPGGGIRQENTTTLWPLVGGPCPFPAFCLNGGTCTYYETLGELVCQCAEGYKGLRCENKDVYNGGSMYPHKMSYVCKLGISSSFYC